jgi:hypothetical protein
VADFNRAAFSREDVPDAKRGQPAIELRDYATARGLEFLDHGTPAGYRAALPGSPDRQHNVMRGMLPGGAYGVLAHETLQLGYSGESFDWGGAFYGVRLTARANMKPWQRLLFFVPVVGDVTTPPATATVSLPCTVAAIRVPETIAVQPCLRIDTRRSAPPYTFGDRFKLDRAGLPGWSAWGAPAPDADLVAALLTDSVRDLLRPRGGDDGLFQLIVWFGTLLVRRNGYLRAPEELDELARAASLVAGELRKACAAAATSVASAGSGTPGSFSDPLLPVVWRKGKPPMTVALLDAWRHWAQDTAARLGLSLEDPHAYHQAFPTIPVPGTAQVVLRGELPQVGHGRLVVHREREAFRPAAVIADPHGAEATPPGGIAFPEQGLRVEAAHGVRAAWSTSSYHGNFMAGNIDEFCAAAARALGR